MANFYFIKTNDPTDYDNKIIKVTKKENLANIKQGDYVFIDFTLKKERVLWQVTEVNNLEVHFEDIFSGIKQKLEDIYSLKIFKLKTDIVFLRRPDKEHRFRSLETTNNYSDKNFLDKTKFSEYIEDKTNIRKIYVYDNESEAKKSKHVNDIRLYKSGDIFDCILDPNVYGTDVISKFNPKKFNSGKGSAGDKGKLYSALKAYTTNGEEIKCKIIGFYDLFCPNLNSILQPIKKSIFNLEQCLKDNGGYFVQSDDSKSGVYKVGDCVYIYYDGCIKYRGIVDGIDTDEANSFDDRKYMSSDANLNKTGKSILIKIEDELNNSGLDPDYIKECVGENVRIRGAGAISKSKIVEVIEDYFDKYGETFGGAVSSTGAYNKIFYGVPGCGKSWHIENEVLKNEIFANYGYCKASNTFRTIFYQDYSHADFVGQYMPRRNKITGQVEYDFVPKVFTKALIQAYQKPHEPVVLIIEEINRGDAASIFGDIFQLLDRDKSGKSEYEIDCDEIVDYLRDVEKKNETITNIAGTNKIYIPSNLYLLATMNTCDQNVFALDTAFKRRWNMEEIPNKFKGSGIENMLVPYDFGVPYITWKKFVEVVNKQIVENSDEFFGDDRQIGCFFVDDTCLLDNANDPRFDEKCNNFAYKVISYLWNDVAKLNRTEWFDGDVKTLHDAIDRFVSNGKEKVFASNLYNKLIEP